MRECELKYENNNLSEMKKGSDKKWGNPAVRMEARASVRSYLRRRTGEANRVKIDGGIIKNKKEVFERYMKFKY